MTRRLTGSLALLLLAAILAFDQATALRLDPYAQPPLLALGSGSAAAGAHCAALPTQ